MNNERFDDIYNNLEEEKPIDYKALIFEYLMYWPWILASIIIMSIGMYAYLRFKAPVYNVNATVLIKQGDQSKNTAASPMQAMQDLGMLSMASNFDNEVEILRSRTLVKKVVNKLNLYIRHSEKQTFRYATDLYKNSPVQVWTTPEEADRLYGPVTLEMTCTPDGKIAVEAGYYPALQADEIKLQKTFEHLPAVLTTPVGVFTLTANADSTLAAIQKTRVITATIFSPTSVAKSYANSLTSEPTSKTTTIAALNLEESNPARGVDFINMLVAMYNEDANNDKNEVAAKTAQFIDERISIINQELGTTENQLASYKQQAGLTDLSSDAQLALQENSAYQQKRAENATQIRLIAFLKSYINNPQNEMEVIPANVGLKDVGLSNLIVKYNELLIERKRLLRTSSESNPAVVQLDAGIRATRTNVITTVNNVEKGLQITQAEIDREGRKYSERISNAPTQEKELMSITRQQEIKASLYLLLLQKREENAITLASTASNGRIIEEAMAGSTPIAPNKKMFYLIALMLGIGIPVASIYLRNLFRFKIESRADVEKITNVPIVGDIPLMETKEGAIVVHENRNDLAEEVFRSVRTNLQYMLQENQNVILFTSTTSGEGKSFIAGNLACSFAFMGKKVVIVGLDIRKPGLNKVFRLSHKERGITQYLADPEHTDLLSLCQPSNISENLYILPGGAVPPNPTELVARKTLDQAIDILKSNFDYVLLDTAPIGIVTDTQLIARTADLSVYICRADYTHKSHYELINDLQQNRKLPNLCTLINSIDMEQRRNGYYYGYGKYGKYGKYGYGKKYGYGYGYGKD